MSCADCAALREERDALLRLVLEAVGSHVEPRPRRTSVKRAATPHCRMASDYIARARVTIRGES